MSNLDEVTAFQGVMDACIEVQLADLYTTAFATDCEYGMLFSLMNGRLSYSAAFSVLGAVLWLMKRNMACIAE